MIVDLLKHEVTEWFPECTLAVDAYLDKDQHVLHLGYQLIGGTDAILLPKAMQKKPAQVDGLWEHTCFEVFLGIAGQTKYCEFNLSPSGDWAAYVFQDYRERTAWINPIRPEIKLVDSVSSLHLSTSIALDELPEEFVGQSLTVGLSAVLESNDLSKSWWAIEHVKAEPDFHLQQGWIPLESLLSQL